MLLKIHKTTPEFHLLKKMKQSFLGWPVCTINCTASHVICPPFARNILQSELTSAAIANSFK